MTNAAHATWKKQLLTLNPCGSYESLGRFPNDPQEAWKQNINGAELAWLLARIVQPQSSDHRRLVGVLCVAVRRVINFVLKGEKRPLQALELTERWTKGDETVTVKMLQSAGNKACAFNLAATHVTDVATAANVAQVANIVYATAYDTAYTYGAYAAATTAATTDANANVAAATLTQIAKDIRDEFSFDEVWAMFTERTIQLNKL